MDEFQVNLISFLVSIQAPPPPSVAVTPAIQLQTEAKKHIMGDERMFERINVFTATNKVLMIAAMVQNSPPNYVISYETDFYHSHIKTLLLLLYLLGALLIEIRKFGE